MIFDRVGATRDSLKQDLAPEFAETIKSHQYFN